MNTLPLPLQCQGHINVKVIFRLEWLLRSCFGYRFMMTLPPVPKKRLSSKLLFILFTARSRSFLCQCQIMTWHGPLNEGWEQENVLNANFWQFWGPHAISSFRPAFSPLSFSILVTLKVKVKSKGKVNMGVRTYPGHYQRVWLLNRKLLSLKKGNHNTFKRLAYVDLSCDFLFIP